MPNMKSASASPSPGDGKLVLTLQMEIDPDTEQGMQILSTFGDFMYALNGREWAERICDRVLTGVEEARKAGKGHCSVTVQEAMA